MSFGEIKAQLDSLLTKGVLNEYTYEKLTDSDLYDKIYFTKEHFIQVANELKVIIMQEIDSSSNLTNDTKDALCGIINNAEINVGYGVEHGETDMDWQEATVVMLNFDRKDLYRQSMFDSLDIYGGSYGGHTGKGVNNIMALFNNGAVNGGRGSYSLKTTIGSIEKDGPLSNNHTYYPPLHFLQRAIDRFNQDFAARYYCIAELGDAYLA